MTTATYTIRLTEVDGEPMLDAAGMALMFGVAIEDVHHLPFAGGASPIPREWLQRGRRRTREAAAHIGSAEFHDVLAYWARRDHGAELEVVYR